VVKVIWHKAASQLHTDTSVGFAGWRQCAAIYRNEAIYIESEKMVAMAMSLSTSGPPSNTWFLGPIRAHNPNGIFFGSTVFAQMTVEYPYTLQWDACFPPKNLPFPMWGSGPHLIHGSLEPPESSTQMASGWFSRFLQGLLVWQTDRPIDYATRSVTVGRIYVHSTAMRPKK